MRLSKGDTHMRIILAFIAITVIPVLLAALILSSIL